MSNDCSGQAGLDDKQISCPACARDHLALTQEIVNIDVTLKRWSDHGVSFNAETLKRYSVERLGPIRLYQCPTCGFGQYHPIAVGDDDFYAAIGQVEYYTADRWDFSRSVAFVQNENAGMVVDVGCGSGLFLDQLRAAVPLNNAVGIEINKAAAAEARSRGHRVEILDWQSESFQVDNLPKADVVVCHQVLEHVKDPIHLLQVLRSLLKRKGLVIVSTPDSAGPVGKQIDALTELPPHHVSKWNERAIRAALSRVGFSKVDAEHEPMPHYLWPGYFPEMWNSNRWPALLGRAAARLGHPRGEGMNWLADTFKLYGIKNIYGVGGHTLLATARAPD